jgi:hypothetical protein
MQACFSTPTEVTAAALAALTRAAASSGADLTEMLVADKSLGGGSGPSGKKGKGTGGKEGRALVDVELFLEELAEAVEVHFTMIEDEEEEAGEGEEDSEDDDDEEEEDSEEDEENSEDGEAEDEGGAAQPLFFVDNAGDASSAREEDDDDEEEEEEEEEEAPDAVFAAVHAATMKSKKNKGLGTRGSQDGGARKKTKRR